MASELHEGSTDNHAVRRYTLTITVAIPPPHRALTVTVSLARVMGPPRCHEHGTTWGCQ